MNPFIAHPGETIVDLGIDFAEHLLAAETVASVVITPDVGITVASQSQSGTTVFAKISIAANQPDADLSILYTVTGTAGSIRKGWRLIAIRQKNK
jgi:pseudouridine-5'-phosphate glycosidase